MVDTDPLTGGLTVVARRDGYLTRATGDRPRDVAVSYLRGRRAAFGLDSTDIAALKVTRRYASESGVVHLWWEQTYRGIPSFDQGLRANVDADGRLINIGGAPRPDLAVDSIVPGVGPREALEAAARSVSASVRPGPAGPSVGPDRATAFDRGHRASLVFFGDAQDVRLAWRVLLFTGDGGVYDAVVDAKSGRLLYRASLVHDVAASAFDNYPGAPVGWHAGGQGLSRGLAELRQQPVRPNTYVHSDVDDDLYTRHRGPTPVPARRDPADRGPWNYAQSTGFPAAAPCPRLRLQLEQRRCFSWTDQPQRRRALSSSTSSTTSTTTCATRRASSSAPAPEASRGPTAWWPKWTTARTFAGGRSRLREPLEQRQHGRSARWQPGADADVPLHGGLRLAGVRDVNGADDAHIVYHEYTHGLSNRLITDAGRFRGSRRRAVGRHGRGVERLLRRGLPGGRRLPDRHAPRPARSARPPM